MIDRGDRCPSKSQSSPPVVSPDSINKRQQHKRCLALLSDLKSEGKNARLVKRNDGLFAVELDLRSDAPPNAEKSLHGL